MKEVSGLKGDSLAWHRDVVVISWGVGEVATYGKCHRLVLGREQKHSHFHFT